MTTTTVMRHAADSPDSPKRARAPAPWIVRRVAELYAENGRPKRQKDDPAIAAELSVPISSVTAARRILIGDAE